MSDPHSPSIGQAPETGQDHPAEPYPRTTVLWSGTLTARGRELNCVIVNVSAETALIQIREAFSFGSKAVLHHARLGDFETEIVWAEGYQLEVRFNDHPSQIADRLAALLP